MGTFNETGYERQNLDAWLERLELGYKSIFGDNIDLSSDSLDGQVVGLFAGALSDLDQLGESVYKAFNPNESFGTSLEALVQLNAITKNAGTNSTVTLTVTGNQYTVVPAGSTVKTVDTGETFVTGTEVVFDATGTDTVEATAQNTGALAALAGTLTVIDSPIAGWLTVNNVSDAAVGEAEETDAQLRIRRAQSVAISSTNIVEGILAEILALENVVAAILLENDTNITDGNGVSPHSIKAVVQGGTDADIANAIWQNKTGGTGTVGDVTVAVTDSQGTDHNINFSRPSDVPFYITVNTNQLANFPEGGATLIQQAIYDYFMTEALTSLSIGDDVIYSQVYVPAGSVVGHSIQSLYIDTSASPSATSDITISYDELASLDLSDIVVNVT